VLKNILDNISLITPNYNEYKVLKENNLLSEENPCSVLIKGGHRGDCLGMDVLVEGGKEVLCCQLKVILSIIQSTVQDAFYPQPLQGTRKRQKPGNGLQKSEIIYRTIFKK
jgi:hypothetical protein